MAGHRGGEPTAAQDPGEPRPVGLTGHPGGTDDYGTPAPASRPLVERWPSGWRPEVEERVAVTAFVLTLCTHEWVHRRVESITFLDENRIRRRVSVDFTLPELPRELLRTSRVRGQAAAYVPLTLLRKRTVVNFDLHDEDGRSLPLLSRRQNNAVGATMLCLLAEATLGRSLPEDLEQDLRGIAMHAPDAAGEAFRSLGNPPSGCRSSDERARLVEEPRMMTLAQDLTNSFLLLVPIAADPEARRVIKFSYEERPGAEIDRSLWRSLPETMNWSDVPLLLPASSLGAAGSYHVEIEVPDELEIASVSGIDLRRALPLPSESTQSASQDYRGLRRVHLHYSGLPRFTWGLIELRVGVARSGLLAAALLSAVLTALLLSVASLRLEELREQAEVSSALLLAIPGVLSSYLLRPGEHPLVSKLFGGVRVVVFLSALCALMAAGALALKASATALGLMWGVLVPLAWTCVAALALSLLLPLDRYHVRSHRAAGPGRSVARGPFALRLADRLIARAKRSRRAGRARPPSDVREAVETVGLDLHGFPVESAEGWRAGFENMDGEGQLEHTMRLAEKMNARRSPRRNPD